LTSFKGFDSEVPSFYFESMPPFAHKSSCKSASEPLNAQYCTWARSHRGRHYDLLVILYLHASDSTYNRSQAAILLWGTDFPSRPTTKLSRMWEVDPVVI